MSGGLQHVDDLGSGPERCRLCGALAVGPCASCKSPVCGDCCVLTEGGDETWAICHRCEKRGGRSLAGAWGSLIRWSFGVTIGLALLALLAVWLSR